MPFQELASFDFGQKLAEKEWNGQKPSVLSLYEELNLFKICRSLSDFIVSIKNFRPLV
jgi:hypothetical protein